LIAVGVPSAYVLWIVFVGTFSAHELTVAAVATILAVLEMCAIDIQYPARFSPSLAELFSIWRLPWFLVSGTWTVLKLAITDMMGTTKAESLFLIVPFHAGGKDGPRAVAQRRALPVRWHRAASTPQSR